MKITAADIFAVAWLVWFQGDLVRWLTLFFFYSLKMKFRRDSTVAPITHFSQTGLGDGL